MDQAFAADEQEEAVTSLSAYQICEWLWAALGVYWLASARQSAKSKTSENHGFRALRFLILATTFTLLLSPWLRFGPLGWRFVHDSFALRVAGVVVTAAGLFVTTWARVRLGRNWSDKIVLKEDHELIRTGPYAYMRHPIYSGILCAIAGTALVIGEWRGVAAFALLFTTYAIKAKREERILAGAFGPAFAEHMQQTGFLLPRFRIGAR
jgi:protein-S-isoprenylcysteine O-methyltransferase Ste14